MSLHSRNEKVFMVKADVLDGDRMELRSRERKGEEKGDGRAKGLEASNREYVRRVAAAMGGMPRYVGDKVDVKMEENSIPDSSKYLYEVCSICIFGEFIVKKD